MKILVIVLCAYLISKMVFGWIGFNAFRKWNDE
jgi:hypothetical protein|nr:MAG TPA: hypothetical protein [Bacteriophage sp.]DAU19531.1 MAG TPA: hypothetical protein [Crassvirales sp.]